MRPRIRRRPIAEINVVPYIDVMLVLLIIFMAAAPLLSQGIRVDLPQAPAEPLPPSEREPLIVELDKDGRIFINYGAEPEQPVAPETLLNRVSAVLAHRPDTAVLIGADAEVPYGRVVRLMGLLQQAGAPSVGMITAAPE